MNIEPGNIPMVTFYVDQNDEVRMEIFSDFQDTTRFDADTRNGSIIFYLLKHEFHLVEKLLKFNHETVKDEKQKKWYGKLLERLEKLDKGNSEPQSQRDLIIEEF